VVEGAAVWGRRREGLGVGLFPVSSSSVSITVPTWIGAKLKPSGDMGIGMAGNGDSLQSGVKL